jgi:ACS family D-galactonate transporter-like MFS transporter
MSTLISVRINKGAYKRVLPHLLTIIMIESIILDEKLLMSCTTVALYPVPDLASGERNNQTSQTWRSKVTSTAVTASSNSDVDPPGRSRATKVRWAVAVFCAVGLAINYIDRSAISVSLPFMTQDFSLTPTEKGLILSAFSWSYALMQIPAGRLIDRFGERVMFGASVLVWSVFTAATAGVSSFGALLALRLGLGVGEAGAYPAAAKTVSHWFPLRLRGRATSVYDSGARIGSAAATPIIALIIGLFGWRAAFLFAGALGILWAIGWWAWYRRPEFKSAVNDAELAIIHESHREQSANNLHPDAKPMRIAELFKQRTVWGMMLGFFCLNFMITFFLTWFPSYLVEERGFNLLKLGAFGMIPPLAAILGSWAGGLVGDYLRAARSTGRGHPVWCREVPL